MPRSMEHILSIPLWFNMHLNTTFEEEISKAGFNNVIGKYKLCCIVKSIPGTTLYI